MISASLLLMRCGAAREEVNRWHRIEAGVGRWPAKGPQESLLYLLLCGASNQVEGLARKNSWIIEGTVAFHQNIGVPHARIREIP